MSTNSDIYHNILHDIDDILQNQRQTPINRAPDARALAVLMKNFLRLSLERYMPSDRAACPEEEEEDVDEYSERAARSENECKAIPIPNVNFSAYYNGQFGYLLQLPFQISFSIDPDFFYIEDDEVRISAIEHTLQWVIQQFEKRIVLGDMSHGKRQRSMNNPDSFSDAPVDKFDLNTLDMWYEGETDQGGITYILSCYFQSRVIVLLPTQNN